MHLTDLVETSCSDLHCDSVALDEISQSYLGF